MTESTAELISSLRASVEVIRDAMRQPVNTVSLKVVSDLVQEVQSAKTVLESRLHEEGQPIEEIISALESAQDIEPEFAIWRGTETPSSPAAQSLSIHEMNSEEFSNKTKKKSKASGDFSFDTLEWDAFPVFQSAPPAELNLAESPETMPQGHPLVDKPPSATASIAPETAPANAPSSASARLRIKLPWKDVGPLLLEDPNASDVARRKRMEVFFRESVAQAIGVEVSFISATVSIE